MTRGLITSINGQWNKLPVVCQCGHGFTLELGDDVKIEVAPPRSLDHKWFVECPRCGRDTPVIWPSGQLRTQTTNMIVNKLITL